MWQWSTESYRRVEWEKHTAVIAAVVAAVGLALTAWGTVKSAQVADDQLTQSQEQREDSVRSQASRITMWAQGGTLFIANRSPDPANALLVSPWGGRDQLIGTLPPCTRMEISRGTREHLMPPTGDVAALQFSDADGRGWSRTSHGRLSALKTPTPWLGGFDLYAGEPRETLTGQGVRLEEMDDCGTGN